MKFGLALMVSSASAALNQVICHSCDIQWDGLMSNTDMWDACRTNGTVIECQDEATMCFTVERQSSDKQVTMVLMGCKQKKACLTNRQMNFWKGQNCLRGGELAKRGSNCFDCCDGLLSPTCNDLWADSYREAASASATDSLEMDAAWRAKEGKF